MKLICLAWLMAAGVIGVAGCASRNTMTESRAPSQSLEGSSWVLKSLPGRSAVPGATPTARFEGGRVGGSDGCNRYSMPFKTDGLKIEIGPMGPSSQMMCPPETMAQAEAFLSALRAARSYKLGSGTLELLDAGGVVVVTLSAQARLLAGTSWNVTNINNGKQAVVSLVSGSTLTMSFDDAGRVSGSTGCNQYNASYTADGDALRFSPVATTRRACPNPAMGEQEQAFLRAIESARTTQFEGDRLTLRQADGAMAIVMVRKQ